MIISQEDEIKNEEVTVNNVLEESIAAYYGALKEKNITPQVTITDKKIVRTLAERMNGEISASYSNSKLTILINFH